MREIPDADKPTTAEDGTPVEGWVRARNVTRVQRESGLTACKRLLRQSLSEDAVLQEISRKSDLRKSISRKSVTELAGVTEEGGEGTAEGGDAADAADPALTTRDASASAACAAPFAMSFATAAVSLSATLATAAAVAATCAACAAPAANAL